MHRMRSTETGYLLLPKEPIPEAISPVITALGLVGLGLVVGIRRRYKRSR
jgi:MYXO-CTERM domain-containing protein